ncbi:histidine kinase [Lacimicrobium sp. SS2-24]|uniref:sensor histidine kinase n=1 Tax=Lacimicrobium sp. SS2-24 TaxID=2005569 RepID=UPI00143B68BB|nr:histidine kinase [Lacimicrobium sp. SS2-24]
MFKYPVLILANVAFWFTYLLLEHISHLLYGKNHWQGSVFVSLFMIMATTLLAWFHHKLRNHSVVIRYSVLLVWSAVTLIIWNNLAIVLHGHLSIEALFSAPMLDLLSGSAYRVLLILCWAGLFALGYVYLEKQSQKRDAEKAIHTAKDAQLQLLMSQLNPHFLFNVLNSLDVAILEKNTESAHAMLVKLSQFLRTTLDNQFDTKIPLEQELKLLGHFVEIEQQRGKDLLNINYHIQNQAKSAFLPPLILQPLAENAIKFSRQLMADCDIDLRASVEAGRLCVEITNPYRESQGDQIHGTQTGLKNVTERLALLYGDDAQITSRTENARFTVRICLPYEVAA